MTEERMREVYKILSCVKIQLCTGFSTTKIYRHQIKLIGDRLETIQEMALCSVCKLSNPTAQGALDGTSSCGFEMRLDKFKEGK